MPVTLKASARRGVLPSEGHQRAAAQRRADFRHFPDQIDHAVELGLEVHVI